jgi:hypothetical protein
MFPFYLCEYIVTLVRVFVGHNPKLNVVSIVDLYVKAIFVYNT